MGPGTEIAQKVHLIFITKKPPVGEINGRKFKTNLLVHMKKIWTA